MPTYFIACEAVQESTQSRAREPRRGQVHPRKQRLRALVSSPHPLAPAVFRTPEATTHSVKTSPELVQVRQCHNVTELGERAPGSNPTVYERRKKRSEVRVLKSVPPRTTLSTSKMQRTVDVTSDASSRFSSNGSTFNGAEYDDDGMCILNYVWEREKVYTGHVVQLVICAGESSKYCSSCSKHLETSAFSLKKKACSDCLSKKRTKRLRGALSSPNNTANVYRQNNEEWRRKCSSCKCMKALTDFMDYGKTCIKCKHRKRVRARPVKYYQLDQSD